MVDATRKSKSPDELAFIQFKYIRRMGWRIVYVGLGIIAVIAAPAELELLFGIVAALLFIPAEGAIRRSENL